MQSESEHAVIAPRADLRRDVEERLVNRVAGIDDPDASVALPGEHASAVEKLHAHDAVPLSCAIRSGHGLLDESRRERRARRQAEERGEYDDSRGARQWSDSEPFPRQGLNEYF